MTKERTGQDIHININEGYEFGIDKNIFQNHTIKKKKKITIRTLSGYLHWVFSHLQLPLYLLKALGEIEK